MIAFNALPQMFGDAMAHIARRQPLLRPVRDRVGTNSRAVRADLALRQQRAILQPLAEKPLLSVEIALCGQKEIRWNAVFVDRPIEKAPFAAHLHTSFVDADRVAEQTPESSYAAASPSGVHPPSSEPYRRAYPLVAQPAWCDSM